jgi:FtsH-binding integral membrane protein
MRQAIAEAIRSSTVMDSSVTAFLRRTYLHLLGSIVALVAFEAYLFSSGLAIRITEAIVGTSWLLILGGFAIATWMARSVAHRSNSIGVQYLALAGYIAVWGILLAPTLLIAQYRSGGGVIESAAIATLAGFTGLTAIVVFSKRDFSFLGSVVRWGGFCARGLIVASALFGFNLGMFFTVAMIALAGASILLDTHTVLNHYPRDRHVGAAMLLFGSIVLLFWYILRLFSSRN